MTISMVEKSMFFWDLTKPPQPLAATLPASAAEAVVVTARLNKARASHMVEEGLRRPVGQAMGLRVAGDVGVVGSGRGDRTSLSSHDDPLDDHDFFFQSRNCSVGWEKS